VGRRSSSLKYSLCSSAIASKSFLATDTFGKFTFAHKQIADSSRASGHLRKMPTAEVNSFDHLVGGDEERFFAVVPCLVV